MEGFILGIIALIAIVVFVKLSTLPLFKASYRKYNGEYRLNRGLFTQAESKFMRSLQRAVGDEFFIAGKVRVVDVLGVKRSNQDKDFYQFFNRVKAKHFDYVLCDKNSFSFLAVLELDDRSHQRPDRIERDNFLNAICEQAGLPLIRVAAAYRYDPQVIRSLIDRSIVKRN